MKNVQINNRLGELSRIVFYMALVFLLIQSKLYASSISTSGNISTDTYWSSDTIKVNGDIIIDQNITLTIQKGVVVEFADNVSMEINGRVIAIGTVEDTIYFTKQASNIVSWGGIKINYSSSDDTTKFSFCKIQFVSGTVIHLISPKCEISDCDISNNTEDYIFNLEYSPVIKNNYIHDNSGKYILKSTSVDPMYFEGNTMSFNYMGILDIQGGEIYIINNKINSVIGDFKYMNFPKITFINCLLYDFSSSYNTLFNNWGIDLSYINCTLDFISPYFLYVRDAKTTIINSIILGKCEGFFVFNGTLTIQNIVTTDENILKEYFTNVIIEDPQFVDIIFDNYNIMNTSPCINEGSNLPYLPQYDLIGNPRINSNIVDIGAYEFQNNAPVLNIPVPDQSAFEDAEFSYTIPPETFIDNDDLDSLTIDVMAMYNQPIPDWLSFTPEDLSFIGTPGYDDVGTISLIATATDRYSASICDTFHVVVIHINHPPVLKYPIPDLTVKEDAAFSFVIGDSCFFDSDITDKLSYSLLCPNQLPEWLNFVPECQTLFGTPSEESFDSLQLVCIATDNSLAFVSDTFNIHFLHSNDPPILNIPVQDQIVYLGSEFLLELPLNTFIDEDQGDSLSHGAAKVNGNPLPQWLTFDPETLAFHGSCDDPDTLWIRIIAMDKSGLVASDTFSLITFDNYIFITATKENTRQGNISIYPNPSYSGSVYISLDKNSTDYQGLVYDVNGRIILKKKIIKNQTNKFDLGKGVYVLALINSNEKVIKRIIIQ